MERIFVLIGIINQLATTRMNRALNELDLPMAQFVLLTHLSNDPQKGWTLTRLANALEVNQPAMTKTTQRLLKKGFLRMETDPSDKRVRVFFPTDEGLKSLAQAWEKLTPDLAGLGEPWQEDELSMFQGLLERLKTQLDEARD
jgi:DNA-binding MarR family transcriptional regulator